MSSPSPPSLRMKIFLSYQVSAFSGPKVSSNGQARTLVLSLFNRLQKGETQDPPQPSDKLLSISQRPGEDNKHQEGKGSPFSRHQEQMKKGFLWGRPLERTTFVCSEGLEGDPVSIFLKGIMALCPNHPPHPPIPTQPYSSLPGR